MPHFIPQNGFAAATECPSRARHYDCCRAQTITSAFDPETQLAATRGRHHCSLLCVGVSGRRSGVLLHFSDLHFRIVLGAGVTAPLARKDNAQVYQQDASSSTHSSLTHTLWSRNAKRSHGLNNPGVPFFTPKDQMEQ